MPTVTALDVAVRIGATAVATRITAGRQPRSPFHSMIPAG
ncbi:hypothetical protein I552_2316 [Mycobacterium xenopi 3993]|nr:hypothetical protein I552_2316 [Mycobacterium xenopi 3993]